MYSLLFSTAKILGGVYFYILTFYFEAKIVQSIFFPGLWQSELPRLSAVPGALILHVYFLQTSGFFISIIQNITAGLFLPSAPPGPHAGSPVGPHSVLHAEDLAMVTSLWSPACVFHNLNAWDGHRDWLPAPPDCTGHACSAGCCGQNVCNPQNSMYTWPPRGSASAPPQPHVGKPVSHAPWHSELSDCFCLPNRQKMESQFNFDLQISDYECSELLSMCLSII